MNEWSECRKKGECQNILQDLGIQLMVETLLSISPAPSPNINSSVLLSYWWSAFERKCMIKKQCGTNYFFLNGKFRKTLSFRLKYIFNILTFPRNMTISDRINEDLNARKNTVEYGNPCIWLEQLGKIMTEGGAVGSQEGTRCERHVCPTYKFI